MRESAAILSRSLAFVGQVGFLMHLARAVDCRSVIVYGAQLQPFVLAIDLVNPAPCIPIPGIANSLILGLQPITLAVGMIGPASFVTPCQQGRAWYGLSFPVGTPTGVSFELQALAFSPSQNVPAFTIALRSQIL